jgi:hypothetical protein
MIKLSIYLLSFVLGIFYPIVVINTGSAIFDLALAGVSLFIAIGLVILSVRNNIF